MPKSKLQTLKDTAEKHTKALKDEEENIRRRKEQLETTAAAQAEADARAKVEQEQDKAKEQAAKAQAAWSHVSSKAKRYLEEGIHGTDRWESSMGAMMSLYLKLAYAINAQYQPGEQLLGVLWGAGPKMRDLGAWILNLTDQELEVLSKDLAMLESREVCVSDLVELSPDGKPKDWSELENLGFSQPTLKLYREALDAALAYEVGDRKLSNEQLAELKNMKVYDLLGKCQASDEAQSIRVALDNPAPPAAAQPGANQPNVQAPGPDSHSGEREEITITTPTR